MFQSLDNGENFEIAVSHVAPTITEVNIKAPIHSNDDLCLSGVPDQTVQHLTLPPKRQYRDGHENEIDVDHILRNLFPSTKNMSVTGQQNSSRAETHDSPHNLKNVKLIVESPRALALHQFAAAIEQAASDHSEYCDILERNMEDNVLASLSKLKDTVANNARYDIHIYGEREWLADEARMWLCDDLPLILRRDGDSLNDKISEVMRTWVVKGSSEVARAEEDILRSRIMQDVNQNLNQQLEAARTKLLEKCRLSLISSVEEQVHKFGLRTFRLNANEEGLTNTHDNESNQITNDKVGTGPLPYDVGSLPSVIKNIIRADLSEHLVQQCITTDSEAKALAINLVDPKLENLVNAVYKPRITETLAKISTNPYAVEEAVAVTIQQCMATIETIREDMLPVIGKVTSTRNIAGFHRSNEENISERSASPVSPLGSPQRFRPSISENNFLTRTANINSVDNSEAPITFLDESRLRQKGSMAEIITEYRGIVEDAWNRRLAKLRSFRELYGVEKYLARFSIEMGEPQIELPARLAKLDAEGEAPLEAIASLSNAGNFTLFLDESDLESLLLTEPLPPDSQLWRELASQLERLQQFKGQSRAAGPRADIANSFSRHRGLSFSPSPNPDDKYKAAPKSVTTEDAARTVIERWQTEAESDSASTRTGNKKIKEKKLPPKEQSGGVKPLSSTKKVNPVNALMEADPQLAAMTFGYSRGELASLQELRKLRQQSPHQRRDLVERHAFDVSSESINRSTYNGRETDALRKVIDSQEMGDQQTRRGLHQPIPNPTPPLPTPQRVVHVPTTTPKTNGQGNTPAARADSLIVKGPNYIVARATTPKKTLQSSQPLASPGARWR